MSGPSTRDGGTSPSGPDDGLTGIYRAFRRTVSEWTTDGLTDERRRLSRKGSRCDAVDGQLLAAIDDTLLSRQEGTGR